MPFSRYSARFVLTFAAAPSLATFAMSYSTMSLTSCSKLVFAGFHPNLAFALVGSHLLDNLNEAHRVSHSLTESLNPFTSHAIVFFSSCPLRKNSSTLAPVTIAASTSRNDVRRYQRSILPSFKAFNSTVGQRCTLH